MMDLHDWTDSDEGRLVSSSGNFSSVPDIEESIAIASDTCYVFGSFELYPARRTLLRNGAVVTIGGRAFDMLLLLVSKAGTVVSASELIDFVWPNVTVEEANLRVQMALLRKVLIQCDLAQRAIETIPLRGYCFILPVRYRSTETGMDPAKRKSTPLVPRLLCPITGREEAIETIAATLKQRQLVTIAGPGGIGKTTVAIAVANRYRNDTVFVDLSYARDGAEAVQAIASALAINARAPTLNDLFNQVCSRSCLLILDTCEHIVEPIAAIAEALIFRCANIRLLVTSREALRAIGEWTYRLPPLTFPGEGQTIEFDDIETFSAIALFIERVQSSMHFDIKRRDLPLLGEICRRLDGIPLALEFAAARVADLGLREIAARLDDRFAILTRARRTASSRHQTLSAALDWSYSLLSEDEQSMLRHLASLDDTFTSASAVSGLAKCKRPAEAISSLYEKSFLAVDVTDDVPVYRLLDTTRAYVLWRNPC